MIEGFSVVDVSEYYPTIQYDFEVLKHNFPENGGRYWQMMYCLERYKNTVLWAWLGSEKWRETWNKIVVENANG